METSEDNVVLTTPPVCIFNNMLTEEDGISAPAHLTKGEDPSTVKLTDAGEKNKSIADNVTEAITDYFCTDEGSVP